MSRFEYKKIPLRWFPQDIIDQYKIMDLVDRDGFVYVEIQKGVCGLRQAYHIEFERLVKILKPHGYYRWYLVSQNAPNKICSLCEQFRN